MQNRTSFRIAFLQLLAVIAGLGLFSSCSVIGTAIGASVKTSRKMPTQTFVLRGREVAELEPQKKVSARLLNGDSLEGIVAWTPARLPASDSLSRYLVLDLPGNARRLVPLESVDFARQTRPVPANYRFKRAEALGEQWTGLSVRVQLKDSQLVEGKYLGLMPQLTGKDSIAYGLRLRVRTGAGELLVPHDGFDFISPGDVPRRKSHALAGFLIGLGVDAIVVIAAANALGDFGIGFNFHF